MVKFLHTADWHLGMKYVQLQDKAEKAREIRLESIKKLLKYSGNVDFVLIAGDLFDSNDVDHHLINTTCELLGNVKVPIYILPGNHDPLTLDSLYWDKSWDSLNNVTILKDSEPVFLPQHNVTIYPSPITQKQSKLDPTDWIKPSEDSQKRTDIRIGLAHGNLAIEGYIDNPNFPINPDRTDISDLDYLALGEWHSLRIFPDNKRNNRILYPGTPETTKFGEENSGKAVIVEITEPHANPEIQELNVGTLIWEKHDLEVNSRADADILHLNIQQTPNPQNRVLILRLKGVTSQDTINFIDTFPEEFDGKFMLLDIITDDLFLKPNILELKAMIPEGAVVNQTFEALMAMMKTQPEMQEYSDIEPERAREIFNQLRDEDLLEDLTPEIINRAMVMMYKMIREAHQ